MKKNREIKIGVGASAGGHMNQLLRLLNHAESWPSLPAFYITTMPELARKLEKKGPVYVVGECNRHHPLKALMILIRGFKIIFKERPDVVITTGSMPIAMVCIVSKLFGTKVVWIDSIANTERFSLSGRLMRHIADLFLTQWPELAEEYDKVEYAGAII
ncbi:MAG: hypothetical protein JW860_02040 [Sedimentisphaerales bacterium]|nr:hypothetical protein [Sedimentisphaerales bacterium]